MQNLSTSISRKYFARWSFPFNHEFANISKTVAPFSGVYVSLLNKRSNLISMRYRNNSMESYDTMYSLFIFNKIPKYTSEKVYIEDSTGIRTEGEIAIKNIGPGAITSFLEHSIRGCKIIEDKSTFFIDLDVDPGETVIDETMPDSIRLYISSNEEVPDGVYCQIFGNDHLGRIISEDVILFNNRIAYETINKYKTIYKIYSDYKVNISSTLDCNLRNSIETSITTPKKISNNNGAFITPNMNVENNCVSIYDNFNIVKTPIIKFDTSTQLTKAFMTANMDIVAIDENGWLVTYKPEKQVYDMPEVNGSINNTTFIYVEDEISKIGENIVAVIYPHKISTRYGTTRIKVSVQNEDSIMFLNSNGNLTTDSNTWVNVSKLNDLVKLSIQCDNRSPYVFCVTTQWEDELYAAAYQDHDNKSFILNNTEDMYVFNSELYIVRDGKTYLFKPRRGVHIEYSSENISFDSDYKDLKEVI